MHRLYCVKMKQIQSVNLEIKENKNKTDINENQMQKTTLPSLCITCCPVFLGQAPVSLGHRMFRSLVANFRCSNPTLSNAGCYEWLLYLRWFGGLLYLDRLVASRCERRPLLRQRHCKDLVKWPIHVSIGITQM